MLVPLLLCFYVTIGDATPISVNAGGMAYWDHPIFANALLAGSWMNTNAVTCSFGCTLQPFQNPQFDANMYPLYVNASNDGGHIRAIIYSLHDGYGGRPATWPNRGVLDIGRWVVSWQGNADVRLAGCTYKSGSPSTGNQLNGRRVYLCPATPGWFDIYTMATPITSLRVSMPDPANATYQALETQMFHPTYIARLKDAKWNHMRTMDLTSTNDNPQSNWIDRRLPSYALQGGVLYNGSCAPGTGYSASITNNKNTGIAYEFVVALANEADIDLWINVPHLATDDFITKLAQLILYGSDGVNPYTSVQANPVWAPLNSNLNLYVEYSNEIWSNGGSFLQGDWANARATALGISKAAFNADNFCRVFRLFQGVWSSQTSRLRRVASVWTAMSSYNTPFLAELAANCSYQHTKPDVLAPTTYFGNGIQDYVWATNWWNYDYRDPYWLSPLFQQRMNDSFNEWMRRLLSGSNQAGAGPDATGTAGGFDYALYTSAQSFPLGPLQLIAYEGGPSLYTDSYDNGSKQNGTGITIFMEAMNRAPQFATVYNTHVNVAFSKGLRTHSMFSDLGMWGKYGQWGHLEYLGQSPSDSVKYSTMLDLFNTFSSVNPLEAPVGSVPSFVSSETLPNAQYALTYQYDITISGGDGVLTTASIGTYNIDGLYVLTNCPQQRGVVRVIGVPTSGTDYGYLLIRVLDSNGDAAWRLFSMINYGAPQFLIMSYFNGYNLASHMPWTKTLTKLPSVTFSGIRFGSGCTPQFYAPSSNTSIVWSQSMTGTGLESTIDEALQKNQYLSIIVNAIPTALGGVDVDLRGAEFTFGITRIDYHAPRNYAIMTNITGFNNVSELYTSGHFADTSAHYFSYNLPNNDSFILHAANPSAIEFRIYGFNGQYAGHKTSLFAFSIALAVYTDSIVVPPVVSRDEYFNDWCPTPSSSGGSGDGLGVTPNGSTFNVVSASVYFLILVASFLTFQ